MNGKLPSSDLPIHNINPKGQIMKKILASVAALAAVTGFASNAFAAGDNSPSGSSSAASYTSDHTGSVTPTCSLKVTDGALPTVGLSSSLTSSTNGSIETVCNSMASTLAVSIDNTSPNTGNLLAAGVSGYAQTFQLSSGSGAYSTIPAGFVTTYNQTDLSNGYSAIPSTVAVTAKVAVGSGFNLPGGAYTVKVKATVTP